MSARTWSRSRGGAAVAVFILALAFVAGACGGDGGFLLEEELTETPVFGGTPVATPTPIVLTPSDMEVTEVPEETAAPEAEAPEATAPPVDITPVAAFEISVIEAVNVRVAPSTEAEILEIIFPDETRTVIGEALGEEALPGEGDLWYALEGGGFVYAPVVETVEAEE